MFFFLPIKTSAAVKAGSESKDTKGEAEDKKAAKTMKKDMQSEQSRKRESRNLHLIPINRPPRLRLHAHRCGLCGLRGCERRQSLLEVVLSIGWRSRVRGGECGREGREKRSVILTCLQKLSLTHSHTLYTLPT